MFKALFKILLLAIIIFSSMIVYDMYNRGELLTPSKSTSISSTQQPGSKEQSKGNTSEKVNSKQNITTGPSFEERKQTKHEKSAFKSIVLGILPERKKWPNFCQKTYTAFNLDETIEPLREKPSWVRLSNMKRDIPQGIIAIEDHNFYNHGAIAMEGIVRALITNLIAGEVVQGGSTITQQLVKNVFPTQERTVGRKVEECFLAMMLERQYTKDEVLEIYLNTTYLGAGATGIKQAARAYFDKAPSDLTLGEAAVIAALPNAPSALNPLENPTGCKKRQLLVLQEMQRYGFISQTQYNEAKTKKIWLTNGKQF